MKTFDLRTTYVQLADGPRATPIDVDENFWSTIDQRKELHGGRLVMAFEMSADWDHWEMHPQGDELLILSKGSMELVYEENDREKRLKMRAPQSFIVPAGVWHRALVSEPSTLLTVTRGSGTRHKPL